MYNYKIITSLEYVVVQATSFPSCEANLILGYVLVYVFQNDEKKSTLSQYYLIIHFLVCDTYWVVV